MPAMSAIPMYASHSHNTASADTPSTFPHHGFPQPTLFQPSELGTIKQLLILYFKTVHRVWFIATLDHYLTADFGYFSFIHEIDFWERFDRNEVPEELSLLMAANALR